MKFPAIGLENLKKSYVNREMSSTQSCSGTFPEFLGLTVWEGKTMKTAVKHCVSSAYQIGTGGGVEGRRGLAPPPIRFLVTNFLSLVLKTSKTLKTPHLSAFCRSSKKE